MKYISLFSGVEGATLAFDALGWTPVAFCEVDEYPASVLANKFPGVPNLGDVSKIDWSEYHGAADVCIGGFPCQSYSVAGLRDGLADPRGQLMLEFLRACKEIDPEWIIGENVPGLLSSNGGRDFETFLNAVAILWPRGGVSWRVLDSQFVRVPDRASDGSVTGWFGPVAQRRRRVFLVVNTRDWRRAAAVLLEPEGMCGDTQTSREKREELAADARRRASASRGEGVAFSQNTREEVRLIGGNGDHVGAIAGRPDSKGQGRSLICQTVTMAHGQANAEVCEDGLVPTLTRIHEAPIVAREQDP